MTRTHRAAWVLPIAAPPIRDGWVAVRGDRIVAVGGSHERWPSGAPPDLKVGPALLPGKTVTPRPEPSRRREVGPADHAPQVAILPGLVNAHVHLELSWMRGLIPPGDSMPAWASALIALRRSSTVDPAVAIAAGIAEARAAGTSLVGDIANTLATAAPLADSPLSAVVFRELIGFRVEDAAPVIAQAEQEAASLTRSSRVRMALAPHAPYSVSPALLRALSRCRPDLPLAIHLGESRDEVEFLRAGTGAWRDVLERVGAWNPSWPVPGCGPVEYLAQVGLLSARTLVVHAVQVEAPELARVAAAGGTIVTCPRSNQWTGAGPPPIEAFYASGARVAIGTDSLASVASLSLFDEMAVVRRLAPGVAAARILQSATLDGAAALGFDDLGAITPGRRAELLAVQLPHPMSTAADVEQYLVSGVPAAAISWLAEP
ncbi:MAG: amidohydrolase family protein [Vicinamibacterales bacterium]